jgi:hypothetical protein
MFETKILTQARARVANWDRLDSAEFQLLYDFDEAKKKQSRGTESVVNALFLACDDQFQGRHEPSDCTRQAFSNMWATQLKDGPQKGSWEWINFGMEPWESDRSPYLGAALAAIAVGAVPGTLYVGGSTDPAVQERIGSLREYLKGRYEAQNLHNKVWMLWASSRLDGLLTHGQKDQLIEQIVAKQQADGGWSVASLGDYARKELPSEIKKPDGYGTGLVVHVLQLAGLPKDDLHVGKGLAWLRANQDPTGAWRALSLNKVRAPESPNAAKAHVGKFMWDAATAYAVLALSH